MVIYSLSVALCFINSVVLHAVLTCAVSACSSISSNSWYSSSSGSAPESRAALAMKYGGSSPMAVPAPWEKNNPDLFSCLFPNTKHVTRTNPVAILRDQLFGAVCFHPPGQNCHHFQQNESLFPFLFPVQGKKPGGCRVRQTRPVLPWGPVERRVAGAVGGWSWWPCCPSHPIPAVPHILTQHCCVSPHHMMPDTFPSMWQPLIPRGLQNNPGAPPRCCPGVCLFSHETLGKCLLENRLRFYYSKEKKKKGSAKPELEFSLSFSWDNWSQPQMKGRLLSHRRKIVFVFSGHQMTHFSLVGKGSFSLTKGKKRDS